MPAPVTRHARGGVIELGVGTGHPATGLVRLGGRGGVDHAEAAAVDTGMANRCASKGAAEPTRWDRGADLPVRQIRCQVEGGPAILGVADPLSRRLAAPL
jgi:hypothetical protein